MKSKVALFGGTFDPIHKGHMDIAYAIKDICKMEKILFVPSYKPPHKNENEISDYIHRYNMVQCALDKIEGFSLSRIEEDHSKDITYIVDVINKIKKENENIDLYFILGSDSLFDIEKWRSFKEILSEVKIICYSREWENKKLEEHILKLKEKYGAEVTLIGNVPIEISSTNVRAYIQNGNKAVKELLPKNVIEYINKHNLYK